MEEEEARATVWYNDTEKELHTVEDELQAAAEMKRKRKFRELPLYGTMLPSMMDHAFDVALSAAFAAGARSHFAFVAAGAASADETAVLRGGKGR